MTDEKRKKPFKSYIAITTVIFHPIPNTTIDIKVKRLIAVPCARADQLLNDAVHALRNIRNFSVLFSLNKIESERK